MPAQLELTYPKSSVYICIGDDQWAIGLSDKGPASPSERYPWGRDKDLLPLLRALSRIPEQQLALLPQARFYFERVNSSGEFIHGLPCSEVMAILVSLGVKARNIFYTGDNQKWLKASKALEGQWLKK